MIQEIRIQLSAYQRTADENPPLLSVYINGCLWTTAEPTQIFDVLQNARQLLDVIEPFLPITSEQTAWCACEDDAPCYFHERTT